MMIGVMSASIGTGTCSVPTLGTSVFEIAALVYWMK